MEVSVLRDRLHSHELLLEKLAAHDAERAALDESVPEAIAHYLANYGELLQQWESILQENRKANMETYWNAIDDFRQPHYELHNTFYFNDDWSMTNRLYYIQGEGFYENYKEGEDAADYSLERLGFASDDEVDLIRRSQVALATESQRELRRAATVARDACRGRSASLSCA